MKKLVLICGLSLLVGACNLSDENKLPPNYHYPIDKFHAYIWRTDSMNSNSKPLNAEITVKNDSITDIESWDGLQKTQKNVFKPVKVRWDQVNGNGIFNMFGISYTVQFLEEYNGTYECPGNYRKPAKEKATK